LNIKKTQQEGIRQPKWTKIRKKWFAVWRKVYICTSKFCSGLMGTTLILAVVLLGFCVVLLGIRIFFVKGGRFPNTHIEGNQALLSRGIRCAHTVEDEPTTEKKH